MLKQPDLKIGGTNMSCKGSSKKGGKGKPGKTGK